jgi:hypothetical protein
MIWAAAIWGFIRSPFGIVLAASLGLLAVEKYGEHKVYEEWQAANIAAKEKIDNTDKRIGEGVDKVDKTETANNEQIDKRNQEARKAYVEDLEKRNAECPVVDGDPLKRLRDVQ